MDNTLFWILLSGMLFIPFCGLVGAIINIAKPYKLIETEMNICRNCKHCRIKGYDHMDYVSYRYGCTLFPAVMRENPITGEKELDEKASELKYSQFKIAGWHFLCFKVLKEGHFNFIDRFWGRDEEDAYFLDCNIINPDGRCEYYEVQK